ncbi:hypothetical protein [Nannocystis pusilla]|uniref:hypothetical protein n=1 Tax=Nannocystis pusilla TaxID=889268 RepID=UPI003B7BADD8
MLELTTAITAPTKCYACDGTVEGYALRDKGGGPARGDENLSTIAVPACARHAWDPEQHPALERLVHLNLEVAPCTIKRAQDFVWAYHRHHDPL